MVVIYCSGLVIPANFNNRLVATERVNLCFNYAIDRRPGVHFADLM